MGSAFPAGKALWCVRQEHMQTYERVISGTTEDADADHPRRGEPGTDDTELLARARAGDRDALGALYRKYRAKALGFARSLVRNGHDAEDVMHEALTKTFSALNNGYGPENNFLAYLYTAIRATAAAAWRKNGRELPVDTLDLGATLDPADDAKLEAVLERDGNEKILAALQSLPARWQTVLWYADVLGEPPRRIAPLLGIAPNAVSALVCRARAGLRAAYLNPVASIGNPIIVRSGKISAQTHQSAVPRD